MLGERLRRDLLAPSGPLALGAIVDLGDVDDFWERVLLTRSATRLHGIFGNRLEQPRGGNAAVPESTGPARSGS